MSTYFMDLGKLAREEIISEHPCFVVIANADHIILRIEADHPRIPNDRCGSARTFQWVELESYQKPDEALRQAVLCLVKDHNLQFHGQASKH